jgi:hypothetical protein
MDTTTKGDAMTNPSATDATPDWSDPREVTALYRRMNAARERIQATSPEPIRILAFRGLMEFCSSSFTEAHELASEVLALPEQADELATATERGDTDA